MHELRIHNLDSVAGVAAYYFIGITNLLLPEIYGPNAEALGREWSKWRLTNFDRSFDALLSNRAPGKLLEAGCATGVRARQFALNNWNVTANDILNRRANIDNHNACLESGRRTPIKFLMGDIVDDNLEAQLGEGYGAVNGGRLLHFFTLEKIDKFLDIINKITVEGAVLGLSFVSEFSFTHEMRSPDADSPSLGTAFCGELEECFKHGRRGTYIHDFTSIYRRVERAGFDVTDVFHGRLENALIAVKRPKPTETSRSSNFSLALAD